MQYLWPEKKTALFPKRFRVFFGFEMFETFYLLVDLLDGMLFGWMMGSKTEGKTVSASIFGVQVSLF